MILAALLLLSTILSKWFCYWFLRTFGQVWNRASQIASLVCPAVLALIFAIGTSSILGPSGVDIKVDFYSTRRESTVIAALILGFAVLITAPSLAIAWTIGSWFSNRLKKAQSQ